jgi:hypothetical protein
MVTIPDFTALMVAYQHGASNSRNRYEKWFKLHETPTMFETILNDMAPSSTAVHSGFSAFNEGEMSVFDFEDFLNQLMSAYVGKQKFLDEAKGAGKLSDLQHKKASALVTRHIAAIVAHGGETLSKSGAVLSFTTSNRLAVSIAQPEIQADDQGDVTDAHDNLKAEES